MADTDPYAPPSADIEVDDPTGLDLASRGARLGGALIDGFLALILMMPLMYLTGYWDRAVAGEESNIEMVAWISLGAFSYLLFHGYLLAKYGQTIGKRVVGTRIVSVHDSKILPLWKVFAARYLPVTLISMVPFVGGLFGLVNALFIFRRDKRCVHDHIAGTRVVVAR